MPMSPRLLRPIASRGFDADARAYIAAVEIADTQPLEMAVKVAINDFIIGCKADGIWTAIKASCILMGARTLSGALTPLAGTAPTNNGPFVSGDYDRELGLIGDATGKYLDTGRAGNIESQDNVHLALYLAAAGQAPDTNTYIATGATNQNSTHIGRTSGFLFFRNRSSGVSVQGTPTTTGFVGNSRSTGASYIVRYGGSGFTVTQASGTAASQNVLVFGRINTALTGIENFSSARIAFYSFGEFLDLALLDTRVSALYTAIGAAIP